MSGKKRDAGEVAFKDPEDGLSFWQIEYMPNEGAKLTTKNFCLTLGAYDEREKYKGIRLSRRKCKPDEGYDWMFIDVNFLDSDNELLMDHLKFLCFLRILSNESFEFYF